MKKTIQIVICTLGFSLFAQQKKANSNYKKQTYQLDTLSINTKLSDFGVQYWGEKEVIFSSPKKEHFFNRIWRENRQGYLELYKGKLNTKGSVVDVEKFSKEINSRYHEAQLALTKDGKHVYFTSNNHTDGKGTRGDEGNNNLQLYKADVVDGAFTNIRPLPFNNKNYSTGHPYLADNDNVLYFISDMPGGYGQTDIYKVALLENETYGNVQNLGSKINTAQKEMFPFIDTMDNVIYFASNREGTKGGLDVYATSLINKNDSVFQLPEPINTVKDDFAFVLGKDNYGFLSSNRDGGSGDDDIYKLTTNCVQSLHGLVVDKKTNTPLHKSKVYVYQNNIVVDSVYTNLKGEFYSNIAITCDKEYNVEAVKEKYYKELTSITTPKSRNYDNNVQLSLVPEIVEIKIVPEIKVVPEFVQNNKGDTIINIEPIYFDYNKSYIREDAAIILDKVVATMKKYPNMIIEGASHTDSRGSSSYNKNLSAKRAKSAVAYIISKGISKSRITSHGYGEDQLVNRCSNGVNCNADEHQLNRRTEFVILKK